MQFLEHVPAEAEPLERAWDERFHHDVELRYQLAEEVASLGVLEIQRDEPLVAAVDLPPEWLSLGGPLPERIAGARLFDLDDIGAEIGEEHAGRAAGNHPGEVEDADSVEWAPSIRVRAGAFGRGRRRRRRGHVRHGQ